MSHRIIRGVVMVDMTALLSEVPVHKLQRIVTNRFEQGNPLADGMFSTGMMNKFVTVPDIHRVRRTGDDAGVSCDTKSDRHAPEVRRAKQSRGAPKSIRNNAHNTIAKSSIFEKVSLLLEYGVIEDFSKYKNDFYSAITTDMYKAFSKRHIALKRDLYEFVYATEHVVSKNRDCMTFFTELVETNLLVCTSNTSFVSFVVRPLGRTIVVPYDASVATPPFDTHKSAIESLVAGGMREERSFGMMKLSELSEYAQTYGISLGGRKKKQDIVDHLTALLAEV